MNIINVLIRIYKSFLAKSEYNINYNKHNKEHINICNIFIYINSFFIFIFIFSNKILRYWSNQNQKINLLNCCYSLSPK